MTPAQHRLLAAGVCAVACNSPLPAVRAQAVRTEDVARCAAIPADAERLACYDQLARDAPVEAPTPAARPAPPPEGSDQSFGVVKPPKARPLGPSQLQAKVLGVTTDSRGVVVQLDNDQTWAIDDGMAVLNLGDAIVIKRAALGSFLMTAPTKRVYRVRRLR